MHDRGHILANDFLPTAWPDKPFHKAGAHLGVFPRWNQKNGANFTIELGVYVPHAPFIGVILLVPNPPHDEPGPDFTRVMHKKPVLVPRHLDVLERGSRSAEHLV